MNLKKILDIPSENIAFNYRFGESFVLKKKNEFYLYNFIRNKYFRIDGEQPMTFVRSSQKNDYWFKKREFIQKINFSSSTVLNEVKLQKTSPKKYWDSVGTEHFNIAGSFKFDGERHLFSYEKEKFVFDFYPRDLHSSGRITFTLGYFENEDSLIIHPNDIYQDASIFVIDKEDFSTKNVLLKIPHKTPFLSFVGSLPNGSLVYYSAEGDYFLFKLDGSCKLFFHACRKPRYLGAHATVKGKIFIFCKIDKKACALCFNEEGDLIHKSLLDPPNFLKFNHDFPDFSTMQSFQNNAIWRGYSYACDDYTHKPLVVDGKEVGHIPMLFSEHGICQVKTDEETVSIYATEEAFDSLKDNFLNITQLLEK